MKKSREELEKELRNLSALKCPNCEMEYFTSVGAELHAENEQLKAEKVHLNNLLKSVYVLDLLDKTTKENESLKKKAFSLELENRDLKEGLKMALIKVTER